MPVIKMAYILDLENYGLSAYESVIWCGRCWDCDIDVHQYDDPGHGMHDSPELYEFQSNSDMKTAVTIAASIVTER